MEVVDRDGDVDVVGEGEDEVVGVDIVVDGVVDGRVVVELVDGVVDGVVVDGRVVVVTGILGVVDCLSVGV